MQDIAQKKSPIALENTKGDFVRILRKRTFSVLAISGSSQGVLRVVSRWNQAPHGETKRERILIIDTFCYLFATDIAAQGLLW